MFQPATCLDPIYVFYLQCYCQFLLSFERNVALKKLLEGSAWHSTAAITPETKPSAEQPKMPARSRLVTSLTPCPVSYPLSTQSSAHSLQKASPEVAVRRWQGDWRWKKTTGTVKGTTVNKTLLENVNNNQAERALPFPGAVHKTGTLERKCPSCESLVTRVFLHFPL